MGEKESEMRERKRERATKRERVREREREGGISRECRPSLLFPGGSNKQVEG